MRKRNLQPTVLTLKKHYNGIYADNEVEATLAALEQFAADYPRTTHGLNDLSEHGLVLSNGTEITAYVETEITKKPSLNRTNDYWWVDVLITFNYFSVDYCTSTEIIRIFSEMFPEMHFNMFSDSYHIESYHI